jgi:hypothetical protein
MNCSAARSTQPIDRLQAICNAWNLQNPPGTVVRLIRDSGEVMMTRTRSKAEVLSGHSAVVWLEGVVGCYHLTHVTPAWKLKLEYR